MKILAYKSQKSALISLACFLTCIGVIFCGFTFGYDIIWGHRNSFYFWLFVVSLCVVSFRSMLEYLRQPQILIEYDDCGIYVYKTKNTEPIIIRYEDIMGVGISVGVGTQDAEMLDLDILQKGFVSKTRSGHLQIRLKDFEIVDVRNVKNAKQVQIELNKLFKEMRNERLRQLEESIEKIRREEELKELEKHNINT